MRPRLSRRRRRQFIIASLLFPLILLGLTEIALRLAGFGGDPSTFRRVGTLADGSSLILADNPGPASYFFANRSRPGTLHQSALVMPKPARVVRIVLAGESAMKGFPQPKALSSAAFLQAMLADAWPDRTVEVINLGTTAVASYPVLGMLTESLDYDPDLCVVYVGNNEFFGAYGVASLHSAGRSPAAIQTLRWFRSLALAQGLDAVLSHSDATADKTLMEAMMGQAFIAPDDAIRDHAARNLGHFTGQMIERCRARGVPVIICTLPANERDLAPLGESSTTSLSQADLASLTSLLAKNDRESLDAAVKLAPDHALAHFRRARLQDAAGEHAAARVSFQTAMNLDPMPWRPPGKSVDAIRAAVRDRGGTLCDLQQAFREASPGGSTGWELMDDHVHPTLAGQALVARSIAKTMTTLSGQAALAPDAYAALPPDSHYIAQLGDNPFDRYGVAHTMRVLGQIPFIKSTNPALFARANATCTEISGKMPPPIQSVLLEWQKPETHKGEQRPITGMVARILVQNRDFTGAAPLFRTAAASVSEYSSWSIEFTYFMLVCQERAAGRLDQADLDIALAAIRRGEMLLGQGRSESGQTERFVGRLHQLRGEFDKAIPFLVTARQKLGGTDLVANDQALADSYIRTGDIQRARDLIQSGIDHSGQYADIYRRMLGMLPDKTPAAAPPPP